MEKSAKAVRKREGSVVIIDDEPDVLDALSMLLVERGYSVNGFLSGAEFLAAFKSGLPADCILLDAYLPQMNGAQIAHEVSKLCPQLPIIGITARPMSPLAYATSRAGARVILTKPVSAEKLLRVVRDTIASSILGS